MTRAQEIAAIEDALRRAAEAIRRRNPDALAGRIPNNETNRGGDSVTPKTVTPLGEKP